MFGSGLRLFHKIFKKLKDIAIKKIDCIQMSSSIIQGEFLPILINKVSFQARITIEKMKIIKFLQLIEQVGI